MSGTFKICHNPELEKFPKESAAYIPLSQTGSRKASCTPDAFVITFFEKVKGWHSIDFDRYVCKKNQVHISFPGQVNSWCYKPGIRGHQLLLSKKYIEKIVPVMNFISSKVNRLPVLNLSKIAAERLRFEFEMLKSDLSHTEEIRLNTINLRIQIILDLIIKETEKEELLREPIKNPLIEHFLQLIEDHFKENREVAYYADKLFISASYLNILAKKCLFLSAKQIITIRVVLEAKRLLMGTEKPIKEITYELGFSSIASFSNFMFKNLELRPRDFRKF